MTRRARRIAALLLGATLSLTLTGNGAVHASSPDRSAATTKVVNILFDAFSPPTVTITHDTTVKWKNVSNRVHTSTADKLVNGVPLWDGGRILPGKSWSRYFGAGAVGKTFKYHCKIHPTMKGTIKVT